MIILGEEYTFTHIEMERIHKKFDNLHFATYNKKDAKATIKEIESLLKLSKKKIIVLNTLTSLSPHLINYLTQLEEKKGIQYITIQSFLSYYLSKLHIKKSPRHGSEEIKLYPYTQLQYIQKRFIDLVSTIFLASASLPLIIYSIYRIKKESQGSILFKQTRIGIHGREFICIKFRSMDMKAEDDGAKFAKENDSRAFKWGAIMRKTKIDELPQLYNVLKGDMHLIGPRPERPIWTKEFAKSIPMYNKRHLVAPGITGWAQIKYHYGSGRIDAQQKLMYDLYYIKNWNLLFDIKIIWKTALYLFTSKKNKLHEL